MTAPNENIRHYGLREPKRAAVMKFADIRTELPVPTHPNAEDYLSAFTDWQTLGNVGANGFGDCVAVAVANMRRVVTRILGGVEKYMTLDQVVELYKTQNPDFDPNGDPSVNGPGSSADGGMDWQTCLEYMHKNGAPDGGQLVAFAAVDPTNLDEMQAALAIFGVLAVGISVSQENENQFDANKPWDYVAKSPILGLHAIAGGGYGYDTNTAMDFITWGQEERLTQLFLQKQVQELYVLIWSEYYGSATFLAGVDQRALATAYSDVTNGKQLPTPSPTPTPTPSGQVVEIPVAVWQTWAAYANAWCHHHHSALGGNKTMAHMTQTLINAADIVTK